MNKEECELGERDILIQWYHLHRSHLVTMDSYFLHLSHAHAQVPSGSSLRPSNRAGRGSNADF